MLYLDKDGLCIHFPDVHAEARCHISFHLDDHPEPSTLQSLFGNDRVPLFHIDDYTQDLPDAWVKRGGLIAPVRSGQKLRIKLSGNYPFAIKIATGKVNAITGEPWSDHLNFDQQDYLLSSRQSTFSGFRRPDGTIHQFVVSPMGVGATIEEEVTGAAEFGGIQLVAYPLSASTYQKSRSETRFSINLSPEAEERIKAAALKPLGLAAAEPVQEELIKADYYSPQDWDTRQSRRCFIHLLDREDFLRITGRRMNGKKATVVNLDYWRQKFGNV